MASFALAALPTLLPYIGSIVSGVEALFAHKPNSGSSKKQAALDMVKAGLGVLSALETAPGSPLAGSQLDSHISSAIDAVVAILNDIGAFKHTAKATAVVTK